MSTTFRPPKIMLGGRADHPKKILGWSSRPPNFILFWVVENEIFCVVVIMTFWVIENMILGGRNHFLGCRKKDGSTPFFEGGIHACGGHPKNSCVRPPEKNGGFPATQTISKNGMVLGDRLQPPQNFRCSTTQNKAFDGT